jgi:hypothetical protein
MTPMVISVMLDQSAGTSPKHSPDDSTLPATGERAHCRTTCTAH